MSPKSFGRLNISAPGPDDFGWALQFGRISSRLVKLILRELFSPVPLPLGRSIRGWRLGFGKMANLIYQLDRSVSERYISDFQQSVKSTRVNGHYDHLLNNKLLLPMLMKALELPSPEQLAFSRNGVIHGARGGPIQNPDQWFYEMLSALGTLVLKPVKGRKGQGLAFVRKSSGKLLINEQAAEISDLVTFLQSSNDAIVSRFACQAEYSKTLYPRTPNTIRMLTIWDYQKGEPFVAAAAQRIGSNRSYPTDNFRAGLGGLSAEIDLKSGSLSRGATLTETWKLAWHERHPETQSQIEGVVIPGWAEICRLILQAAEKLAWTPQIAWDLLVTDDGLSVIEVNGSPGLPVHQVHGPLIRDSRYLHFYQTHGVIPSKVASMDRPEAANRRHGL